MLIHRLIQVFFLVVCLVSTAQAEECLTIQVDYSRTVGEVANLNNLKHLAQGQCADIVVKAKSRWNATGLLFKKAEGYQIEVVGTKSGATDTWQDGPMTVDGNGWSLPGSRIDPDCFDSVEENGGPPHEEASSARLFISLARQCRRSPSCPWFYLIGVVQSQSSPDFSWHRPFITGNTQAVPLGNRGIILVRKDGEFGCFANDLAGKYANNQGELLVRISRINN